MFACVITSVSLFYACNSNPKSKLVGTWKAETVDVKFDEQRVSPEMIRQVGLENKQVFFKIQNDSTMQLYISANGNPQNLFWFYNVEDNKITYGYKIDDFNTIELGKLIDGKIISESETPLGKIVTTFKQEK